MNEIYFELLKRQYLTRGTNLPLRLAMPGEVPGSTPLVFPTSMAPPSLLETLKITQYNDLPCSARSHARLWLKKLQAGTGSSLKRTRYLSRLKNLDESEIKLGTKSTDLFVELPERDGPVSLAELQILRAYEALQSGAVSELWFQDLVGPETARSLSTVWSTLSLPQARHLGAILQDFVPTLDEAGKFTRTHTAPAGHGFFAFQLFLEILDSTIFTDPSSPNSLVSCISNGEDLGAFPDSTILNYILKERVPIVLLVTERLSIDRKGGVVSLVADSGNAPYLTLFESAQADEAGQTDYFESIGMGTSPAALLNTNMALFNYEVLVPQIRQWADEVGRDAFISLLAPDLICNRKKIHTASQGLQTFTQLEGAMGSLLFNLDRHYRARYHSPLVHLVSVPAPLRSRFFTPVKTAFDYFVYYASDRFRLNPLNYQLEDQRPGHSISAQFTDPAFDELDYVLEAFKGARIYELDELFVAGPAQFSGKRLSGKVRIENGNAVSKTR